MGKAADALDSDKDEFGHPFEFAEIFQIHMNVAKGYGIKGGALVGGGRGGATT